jgi:hypothetical protein
MAVTFPALVEHKRFTLLTRAATALHLLLITVKVGLALLALAFLRVTLVIKALSLSLIVSKGTPHVVGTHRNTRTAYHRLLDRRLLDGP